MSKSLQMDSWWQQIRRFPWLSVGWLTIGTGVLVLCFLLWTFLQLGQRSTVEVTPASAASKTVGETPQLPDRLEGDLGMLLDAVPALDLSKRVAVVGQRAPEFRGMEFIKANASHWTLQVMKVSQESVVKSYLSQRKDKQRFQYFRVVEGAQEYYLLTYGDFTTVQTAMGALQTMQFDLPNSVKAFPERFSTYQASVKDQGSEERMSGVVQKVRQIRLNPVAAPIELSSLVKLPRNRPVAPTRAEPAFGALPADQVAAAANSNTTNSNVANTAAAISLPASPAAVGREPSTPATVAPPSPPAPVSSPVAVQDPFN